STAGVASFGALSLPLDLLPVAPSPAGSSPDTDPATQEGWNTTWPSRVTGRHKAIFDVAEIESGFGVWRANAWVNQYNQVLKIPVQDMTPVVVIRHNAIILAMQQSFWDRYGIAKLKGVTHPLTGEPIDRNPALIDEKDGVPAPFNQAGLHKQLARGVTVLACNLALQDLVELVKNADKSSEADAQKVALAGLVPGVILQPSGVFAVIRAQEAGCAYIKAS
ncbi:MAG TPA: hypothetical protein VFV33_27210, partial [Gemmatimonadaceae bacterium]|nr:hypothetical protein [Gemmatimonadaceae bacterium]